MQIFLSNEIRSYTYSIYYQPQHSRVGIYVAINHRWKKITLPGEGGERNQHTDVYCFKKGYMGWNIMITNSVGVGVISDFDQLILNRITHISYLHQTFLAIFALI